MQNPLAPDLDEVLARVGALWGDLRGARIFITGGTGFFGRWLLETLLWANDRLGLGVSALVLTRRPEVFARSAPHLAAHPSIAICCGDVRSFEFPGGAFSHVIHAATDSARQPASRDDHQLIFDTIVEGTRRVLAVSRRAGVRRLLFVSSGAVYGRQPVDMTHISEEYLGGPDPALATSAYAEGKRAAESLCVLQSDGEFQPVIARGFAFIGPHLPLDAHFAAGNFIRDARSGGPIRIAGDGTPYRSYLYASELAVWLWTLLLRGGSGRAYNVGSETPVSISTLAATVARAAGPAVAVETGRSPEPSVLPERYVPSTVRARRELGLCATIGLDEAVARTLAWYRQQLTLSYGDN